MIPPEGAIEWFLWNLKKEEKNKNKGQYISDRGNTMSRGVEAQERTGFGERSSRVWLTAGMWARMRGKLGWSGGGG